MKSSKAVLRTIVSTRRRRTTNDSLNRFPNASVMSKYGEETNRQEQTINDRCYSTSSSATNVTIPTGNAMARILVPGSNVLNMAFNRYVSTDLDSNPKGLKQNRSGEAIVGGTTIDEENEDDMEHGTHEADDSNNDNDIENDNDDDIYDYDNYDDEERDNKRHENKKYEYRNQHENHHKRIWLDPSTPLVDRVNRVLERPIGTLHPLDIKLASVDLIRECGKLKSFEGMKYAHDIFDRLLEEKRHVNASIVEGNNSSEDGKNSNRIVIIPSRVFITLMYGWSRLSNGPERMREIIDIMEQETEYDEEIKRLKQEQEMELNLVISEDNEKDSNIFENLSCQPTTSVYNTLLIGLAEAAKSSIAAASEAEGVLSKMMKMNRQKGWHTRPNTRSFTLVINAFARTRHVTAGDRAEAVLQKMIETHHAAKLEYLEEEHQEYNIWDLSLNKRKIVTPDHVAYTATIQAHAQSDSDGSAEKALGLLLEVLQSDHLSTQVDAYIFANTINAFARLAGREKSAKDRIAAAERAEEILVLMIDEIKRRKQNKQQQNDDPEELQETIEEDITGDHTSTEVTTEEDDDYNYESDEEEEEQELLSDDALIGNVVPFNSCLNAYAQSFSKQGPIKAEKLLHKMLDPTMQEITNVHPDTTSFNICLNGWAKASKFNRKAPEKAEELLTLLVELYGSGQLNDAARPDVQSYTTVMNAYGKSGLKDKTAHARRLLDTMINNIGSLDRESANPKKRRISSIPFTVVLNASAHSPPSSMLDDDGTLDSFDDSFDKDTDPYSIALKTYSELREDTYRLGVKPDHICFASMLDVIGKHTDQESIERREMVELVFGDACEASSVSGLVVQALHRACPTKDMLESLLLSRRAMYIDTVNALPREWTRNVHPRHRKIHYPDSSSNTAGSRRGGKKRSKRYNSKPQ